MNCEIVGFLFALVALLLSAGPLPQHMIRQHDRGHGFGHGDEAGEEAGVVAALGGDGGGLARGGDGLLILGEAAGGFDGAAEGDR